MGPDSYGKTTALIYSYNNSEYEHDIDMSDRPTLWDNNINNGVYVSNFLLLLHANLKGHSFLETKN